MLQIFADFLAILGRQCLKFLNSLQPLGMLVLRVALGAIFLTHGYPKLTHTSGALGAMFVQHGLPAYFVYVSGVLETFGSLLLVLGLFTRGAALLLTVEMAVAIVKVHSVHGVMALHEYEFPLALGCALFVLATVGAGIASVDHFIFGEGSSSRRRPQKSPRE
jgi:putative oxidoreductase